MNEPKSCWIQTDKKVITFTAKPGYDMREFTSHDELLQYALLLADTGYRIL